jgi:uncharacterized protein (DUF433 family)
MVTEIKTEHPHIVRSPGVCGGRPRIKGTRIAVDFIARFLQSGTGADDILALYPYLTRSAIHDAISFYYDHQDEIDAEIAGATIEKLAQKYDFQVENGRVVFNDL